MADAKVVKVTSYRVQYAKGGFILHTELSDEPYHDAPQIFSTEAKLMKGIKEITKELVEDNGN